MKEKIAIGEKYDPTLKITDQAEADAYFEECVQHTMTFGISRTEAEKIEKANIGYYSGYADHETMQRVQKLFRCCHPVFGSSVPTPQEALDAGRALATTEAKS